jgi:hypothetical protein
MGQKALYDFLGRALGTMQNFKGPEGRRKEVVRFTGQVVVTENKSINLETRNIIKALGGLPNGANSTKLQKEARQKIHEVISAMDGRFRAKNSQRHAELFEKINDASFKKKAGITSQSNVYIIGNYEALASSKSKGALRRGLIEVYKKYFNDKDDATIGKMIGGAAEKGSKAENLTGYQLGHGEIGAPVSGLTAGQVKQSALDDPTLSKQQKERLVKIFEDPKFANLKLNIDHTNNFTADGKLTKNYVLIISLQSAKANQSDATQFDEKTGALGEGDAIKAFEKDLASLQKLVEGESSTPIAEMLRQSILASMTKSPFVKGDKTKETFREKSRATRPGKFKYTPPPSNIVKVGSLMEGVKRADVQGKRGSSKGRKNVNPMQLLKQINARLPEKVAGNMEAPALENRTGRFAASTRAVNVDRTAKGFPSISYTYQKNPYQIYETSTGKRPWSSLERDPRTLIDRSIREIAVELQLGRFYTRRV